MATLLKIQSSLFNGHGQSSALVDQFEQHWLSQNVGGQVIARNLATEPVPHLDQSRFQALTTPAHQRTDAQQAVVDYSDALIAELIEADTIVLGVPMYNFSVPSVLRAYFDHIARSGVTFRYTAAGPEGLIKGKKVYVVITRGGYYGEDHGQTQYLREFLAFIGINDVTFVYAEGLAISDEARQKGLTAASEQIAAIAA
ncbi:MAG: NAD(P)H-dependent oxidoreductase [Pseudomonadota bacterium]|nr:NAD(P)H-dependent oxidoreductase [Pseudomonadota bacterium]